MRLLALSPFPFLYSRVSGERDSDAERDRSLAGGDLDLEGDLLGDLEWSGAGEEALLAAGGVCDLLRDRPREADFEEAMVRFLLLLHRQLWYAGR